MITFFKICFIIIWSLIVILASAVVAFVLFRLYEIFTEEKSTGAISTSVIREGKVVKGGVNEPPKSRRPFFSPKGIAPEPEQKSDEPDYSKMFSGGKQSLLLKKEDK